MKIILASLFAITMLATAGFAINKISAVVSPSGVSVNVPNVAVEKSLALEPGSLQRTVFIHYREGFAKGKGNGKSPCSKLLGVKWKSFPISYVVHPDLEAKDAGAIHASAETWDAATSRELFNTPTFNATANWDSNAPDLKNELSLGNYPEDGVIAVTIVWAGIPIGGKGLQIIEYDILFDTDYNWGDAGPTSETSLGNTSVMDLENIATHEKGHGVGEDDIYDGSCTEVTMFGLSENGETKKRTLATPDISGLQKMYGA